MLQSTAAAGLACRRSHREIMLAVIGNVLTFIVAAALFTATVRISR